MHMVQHRFAGNLVFHKIIENTPYYTGDLVGIDRGYICVPPDRVGEELFDYFHQIDSVEKNKGEFVTLQFEYGESSVRDYRFLPDHDSVLL
ncbi:MAG: hypothetical protein AMS17_13315 [Spirochaetes bacterium DG_61]|nr:MAG: hypothetical protein AMS17_13315 [Spirochaetes bacterium DG_61]